MEHSVISNAEQKPNIMKPLSFKESQKLESEDSRFLQESHHFLSFFPKEVWDYICSFLSSKDFHNLNNSSPFFQQLFLRKRVLLLFEPVLEVMLPKLIRSNTRCCYQERQTRSLLLNHRLTCKTWRRAIDNLAGIWKDDKHKKYCSVHNILSVNYKFSEFWQVDEFLERFKATHPTHVNPFPGKCIILQVRPKDINFPLLSSRISQLLKFYGQHLRSCEFRTHFDDTNPSEFRHKIVKWLGCMPNLENLIFHYFFDTLENMDKPVQLDVIPSKFSFLRKLSIETNCPHSHARHIPDWSWIKYCHLNTLVHQHNNLEYLNITIINKSDVKLFKNVSSPLKTLEAQYYSKENDICFSHVFANFEKFSNTLEDVTVTFRESSNSSLDIEIMRDSFHGRLNLPNVRKFDVYMLSVYSLDFILGMKENLEELKIKCLAGRPDHYNYGSFSMDERKEIEEIENKQIIKFLGYQDKLSESNIWNLFPKLGKISIHCVPRDMVVLLRKDCVFKQTLGDLN